MLKIFKEHKWPLLAIVLLFLVGTWRLLLLGIQVRGDLPFYYANPQQNIIADRILFSWVPFDSLGKTATLSFDTLQSLIFSLIDFNNNGILHFYIYYLPLLLSCLVVYFIAHTIFKNKVTALLLGGFYIANPVIFGDFRSGQTMWIYTVLPVVYYLTFLLIRGRLKTRGAISLAVAIFLAVAVLPPMLVPLAVFIVLMTVAGLVLFYKDRFLKRLSRLILTCLIIVGPLVLMLAPLLFSAASGQEALFRSSVVADYLNNYSKTGPENVLRLAGNQGNGQLSLGYNDISTANIFGYTVILLIVIGLVLSVGRKEDANNDDFDFSLLLLPPLLVIIGFFYLTYFDKQLGIKFFTSSWLAATIRNPTKLFVLILFPVTTLMGFGVNNIAARLRDALNKTSIVTAFYATSALCLLVYGWPFLRGDVGLFYGRDDKQSMFMPSKIIQQIHLKEALSSARSLLIPTTHLDELNFQTIDRSLNALREGGLDHTTVVEDKIKKFYNEKDPQFAALARMIGLNVMFQKKINDNDPSYAPFSSSLDFSEASNFLRDQFGPGADRGDYIRFNISDPNPLLFTPRQVSQLENYDVDEMLALSQEPQTATFGGTTAEKISNSVEYKRSNQYIAGRPNRVLLNDNRLVRVAVTSATSGRSRKITIKQMDPFGANFGSPIALGAAVGDRYMFISGRFIDLDVPSQAFIARGGSQEVKFYSENEVADPSSQGLSLTSKGDASNGSPGRPDISIENIAAKNSPGTLRVYAKNHTAYASKRISFNASANTITALIGLTYQTTAGQGPSYAVIKEGTGEYVKRGVLPPHESQTHEEISFQLEGDQTSGYLFYLYSIPSENNPTENIFSSLSTGSLEETHVQDLELVSYPHNFVLPGPVKEPIDTPVDLIENSSFDNTKGWSDVGDASINRPGGFKIQAEYPQEGTNKFVEIKAVNHNAYVAQSVSQFDPNATYRISFNYKNVNGAMPAVALVQGGTDQTIPLDELSPKSKTWQSFEQTFAPSKDATSLTVFLYSPANGGTATNQFDNVKIEKLPLVREYLATDAETGSSQKPIISSYIRKGPTQLEALLTGAPGLIVFNESYHAGWKAFIADRPTRQNFLDFILMRKPGVELPKDQHFRVNEFANGWNIQASNQNKILVIEYWPQRRYALTLVMAGLTFLGCMSYLTYDVLKKRANTLPRIGEESNERI
jgi:hypothetical protein